MFGKHFIITSDQQSLKPLLNQTEIGPEYQKWVGKLFGFDFEIKYKPGVRTRVEDVLSRSQPATTECNAILSSHSIARLIFFKPSNKMMNSSS